MLTRAVSSKQKTAYRILADSGLFADECGALMCADVDRCVLKARSGTGWRPGEFREIGPIPPPPGGQPRSRYVGDIFVWWWNTLMA